jgi:two-component system sensor histidine kinase AlgZ
MHPILSSRAALAWYLLACLAPSAGLAKLFVSSADLRWTEAAALAFPLTLFYALVCLSPWYISRTLPLRMAQLGRILINNFAAALVAALLWLGLAKALALGLSRWFLNWFPNLDARFSPQLPMVFGVGVLLYLLAVALHYVLLSVRSSRDAETRAHEARALAREAELKALRAQINPHFLFNSLNSISALAIADGRRAREMCIRLSDFLRKTLAMGDRASAPLSEELALARAYLEIEQVRFGERLRVEEEIEADCGDCLTPPLILQPLVENAVKHGIAGLLEGGVIRLRASCAGGFLHLEVENRFDADAPPARKSGLGLENVRGRLRARYEEGARVTTATREDSFLAELTLPCERDEIEGAT